MMRSVWENPITIAVSANATGKTHGAARLAAAFFLKFEDAQVYTGAAPPLENLEKLLWGEIGSLTTRHPAVFTGFTHRHLHIERDPRSFITGVAIPSSGTPSVREAKWSGKHAPHILFVLDEADAVPEEVYKGIESCMSGGWARLLLMYNPRHQSGAPYRMIRDGLGHVVHLSALDHPNVVTGEDVIPGAVSRQKTVARINEWCRPWRETDLGRDSATFTLPDFLEGAVAVRSDKGLYPPLQPGKYVIEDPAFSYMVLGQYPAQAEKQLVSREWVNRARSRYDAYVLEFGDTLPDIRPIMGQDMAEQGKDLCCCCRRYGGFVPPLVRWGGLEVDLSEDRIVAEYERFRPYAVNVDATGMGLGVAPHLRRRGVNAHGIMVAESPTKRTEIGAFALLRDQLLWEVREWLRRDPSAMLPPDEKLQEELLAPTFEVVNGKIKVMKKDDMRTLLGRSPDSLDALALTFADPDATFNPMDVQKCLV